MRQLISHLTIADVPVYNADVMSVRRKVLIVTNQQMLMPSTVFVKFVSEPQNDPMKSIVGLACTSQAIAEGHEVKVFFAAAGTRLLDPAYIETLNGEFGPDSTMISDMMETICTNALLYCSFASVKATLGHNEGDEALVVPDENIEWSGPPGVIALATSSDVQLTY